MWEVNPRIQYNALDFLTNTRFSSRVSLKDVSSYLGRKPRMASAQAEHREEGLTHEGPGTDLQAQADLRNSSTSVASRRSGGRADESPESDR